MFARLMGWLAGTLHLGDVAGMRRLALVLMVPLLAAGAWMAGGDAPSAMVSTGPIQAGHATLECADCHLPARGTIRQQIQANVRAAMGWREASVDFGAAPVATETCIGCHERPNERHPVWRFHEPRFAEARTQIDATDCLACHGEHTGLRLAITEIGFCAACHSDLRLKDDPVDVPHTALIAARQWESCLGCHDFHGNHPVKPPRLLEQAFEAATIRAYFADGPDPYGPARHYKAKTP